MRANTLPDVAGNEKISIVTPVFNRVELLRETAESLFAQTYPNWEWILVDDGSTEETLVSIEELAAADSRIKVLRRNRDPKGACTCRNIGLENSTGSFVIFLDSDDLLHPDCLNSRIMVAKEQKENEFYVFPSAFFSRTMYDADAYWNRFDSRDDLTRFLWGDPVWHTSGPLWKAEFLFENKLKFHEYLLSGQDWHFHLIALLKKKRHYSVAGIPDSFVRRDVNQPHISKDHFAPARFQNRNEIMCSAYAGGLLNEDEKILLGRNIALQILSMVSRNQKVPQEAFTLARKTTANDEGLRNVWRYLSFRIKTAGRQGVFHRLISRLLFSVLVKKKLYYFHYYRSPMSSEEKHLMLTSLNKKQITHHE